VRFLIVSLIAAGIIAPLAAVSARAVDLSRFLPGSTGGWSPTGEDRTFTRETIFEYIDGAGEIYLGFAFRRLLVREYAGGDKSSLVAEIYDMAVPEDAFGIYSHDQDGEDAAVGARGLYSAGLLRFWKGPYFVRLLAEKETEETKRVVFDLGRRIAAAIPDASPAPRMLRCLPAEGRIAATTRYFHKQVSLNTLYYLADENVLELDARTEVALARYGVSGGKVLLLICRYASPADARRALVHFGRDFFSGAAAPPSGTLVDEVEPKEFAAARLAASFLIVVLESPDRATCTSLLDAAASRIKEVLPWPVKPSRAGT